MSSRVYEVMSYEELHHDLMGHGANSFEFQKLLSSQQRGRD